MNKELNRRAFILGTALTAASAARTAHGIEKGSIPEGPSPKELLTHIFFDEPFPTDSLMPTITTMADMINHSIAPIHAFTPRAGTTK